MNAGRIEQVGTPGAIYRQPRTLFVARFIGESNLWEGTVGAENRRACASSRRPGSISWSRTPPAAPRASARSRACAPRPW